MDPRRAERLCAALAAKVVAAGHGNIDLVVSPAMGGVIVGYEMARQLGVPGNIFRAGRWQTCHAPWFHH